MSTYLQIKWILDKPINKFWKLKLSSSNLADNDAVLKRNAQLLNVTNPTVPINI